MSLNPRIAALAATSARFFGYFQRPDYQALRKQPELADFAFGNPQELPLVAFQDILARAARAKHKDWFAYKLSEPEAVEPIRVELSARLGLPFASEDVFMTPGAFGGLALALRALTEPGDEVVMFTPPWFFYDTLICAAGASTVRVRLAPPDFALHETDLERAITARTRAVILNTPHNPSGRHCSPRELAWLAGVLERKSREHGRRIYLISDEAYRRILFDGRSFDSPASHYAHTLIVYTYAKTLLTPGQRLGYVATHPDIADRAAVHEALFVSQFAAGFAFPNATMQYATAELEPLSIDIAQLETRRDRIVAELERLEYQPIKPEGTFYVMCRTPDPDDVAFSQALERRGTLVLPGSIVELPGWMRLSLTASDAMVDRGLEALAAEARR